MQLYSDKCIPQGERIVCVTFFYFFYYLAEHLGVTLNMQMYIDKYIPQGKRISCVTFFSVIFCYLTTWVARCHHWRFDLCSVWKWVVETGCLSLIHI